VQKLTGLTQLREAEPDLTIRRTRVRALEIVPERPIETAAGTLTTVPLVLIDLDTGEGVVGCSYLRCYTPLALAATARLVADLAETIAGSALAPVARSPWSSYWAAGAGRSPRTPACARCVPSRPPPRPARQPPEASRA